jgi:hypothetical protein
MLGNANQEMIQQCEISPQVMNTRLTKAEMSQVATRAQGLPLWRSGRRAFGGQAGA